MAGTLRQTKQLRPWQAGLLLAQLLGHQDKTESEH